MPAEMGHGLGSGSFGGHEFAPEVEPANQGNIRRIEDELAAEEEIVAAENAAILGQADNEQNQLDELAESITAAQVEWPDAGYPDTVAPDNPYPKLYLTAQDLAILTNDEVAILTRAEARAYLVRMGVLA